MKILLGVSFVLISIFPADETTISKKRFIVGNTKILPLFVFAKRMLYSTLDVVRGKFQFFLERIFDDAHFPNITIRITHHDEMLICNENLYG